MADRALDFYNQSNRTSHESWDFDTTGYLQRSTADLVYCIDKAIRESETQDKENPRRESAGVVL